MQFINNLLTHLRKFSKQSLVVLTDESYGVHKFYTTTDGLTEKKLEELRDRWGSLTASVVDIKTAITRFHSYAATAAAEEQPAYKNLVLPDTENIQANIDLMNRTTYSKGVLKSDVTYRPVLNLDIDLKDNQDALFSKGLITRDVHEYPLEDFGQHIKDLPGDTKKEMVVKLLNIEQIVSETAPSAVVFTGNGAHLWYGLDAVMTDADQYEFMHDTVKDVILAFQPDLKFDQGMSHINRYFRIPGSFNNKGRDKVLCEVLYESGTFDVVSIIKDAATRYKTSVKKRKKNTPAGSTKTPGFSIYQKPVYTGMVNIQRDIRLYKFVKEFLTYEAMCGYCDIPVAEAQSFDGYYLTKSPLRQDSNPSFQVCPERMICSDFGTKDSYDFGQIMQKFIDMKKKEYGINTKTTRYEAELHCVMCAFMAYNNSDSTWRSPKDFPFITLKKKDPDDKEEGPPKAPPGRSYYLEMQTMFLSFIHFANKHRDCGYDTVLKHFIKKMPDIYFFYEYQYGGASKDQYQKSVAAISLINMLNKIKIGVIPRGQFGMQIYMINELGLHQRWEECYPYGVTKDSGAEKTYRTKIQFELGGMNVMEAGKLPPGAQPLNAMVLSLYAGLRNMPEKLHHYFVNKPMSTEVVKHAVSQYIYDEFSGVYVSPKDLDITWLSPEYYIEFNNVFVLYDASDPSRIGETIPVTDANRTALMQRAVLDIRIERDYALTPGPTPLWDKYLASMEYNGNMFRQIMSFFLGSVFYRPNGGDSRAVFLYGRSGNNGKSVMAEILIGLWTERYVTTKEIVPLCDTSDLGRQTRAQVVKSLMNVSPDTSQTKIGLGFKALVSGEPVNIRNLYESERNVAMRVHLLVNTNTLPSVYGETMPFKRRALIIKVLREIPPEERIPFLAQKILETESATLWHWIIQQAKLYRTTGVTAFLSDKEVEENESIILNRDDLYAFVEEHIKYDPNVLKPLTANTMKRLYNVYRSYISKNIVKTDSIIEEAEMYILKKFKEEFKEHHKRALDQGFDYRVGKARGLPVRIYVPEDTVGNPQSIDSAG